jgi:blocked-early-in-transport protein 1
MRNPGGGYGNPGARSRGGAGNAYQNDYMEQQNDEQINLIAGKVGQLKELSIAIGSHVKEDNRLLGDLDNSFDSAGSLLSGTMKRLGSLADSGGNRHMLYLALFVIFVLLLVYKLFR